MAMTREEAASVIEWAMLQNYSGDEMTITEHHLESFKLAIAALRDPDTGLVPCGCGGKARLLRKPIGNWVDHKIACDSCTMETAWVAGKDSAEMAKIEWNTAMGWKGGTE